MSPAIKAMRQPLSFIPKPRQPPNIPLMPAIRPVNSINNAAERPISAPPIAAETGVKLAMTLPCDPCPPGIHKLEHSGYQMGTASLLNSRSRQCSTQQQLRGVQMDNISERIEDGFAAIVSGA
jgi:hypothetical protein